LYKCARQDDDFYEAPPETNIVTLCTSNDYVFVPVNDGLKPQFEAGRAAEKAYVKLQQVLERDPDISDANLAKHHNLRPLADTPAMPMDHGSHWTLLVVNCTGPVPSGVYLDSYMDHAYRSCPAIAKDILHAVDKAQCLNLSEDEWFQRPNPKFIMDPKAPDQFVDNACVEDRSGACGPFVALTKRVCRVYYSDSCWVWEGGYSAARGLCAVLGVGLGGHAEVEALVQRERRVRSLLNGTGSTE